MIAWKSKITALIFTCFCFTAQAQDTLYVRQLEPNGKYPIRDHLSTYADSSGSLSINEAASRTFKFPFEPETDLLTRLHQWKEPVVWLRCHLVNPKSKNDTLALVFNYDLIFSAYSFDSSGFHLLQSRAGFYTSEIKKKRRSLSFVLPAGSGMTLYIKTFNPSLTMFRAWPMLTEKIKWEMNDANEIYRHRYFFLVDVFFISVAIFIIVHTLAQYFFNRRKEFLLYVFYCIAVLAYLAFKLDNNDFIDMSFSHFPYILRHGNASLSYLLYLGYYSFVRHFSDFRKISQWFNKVILFTQWLLVAAIIVDLLMIIFNFFTERQMLFIIVRCYVLASAFVGLVLLIRSKNKIAYFIAAGSGLLLLGGLTSMIMTWVWPEVVQGFGALLFMQLGIILELVCFTLGLSYKTSLIEKDKIAAQQQLIDAQQQLLEREKEQQLNLEFKKKLTEMELQLLKSQLNPHFYFNTLNNLYGLTLIDPKKAPDAILKLSDIMEYVIYDCKSEKVPLEKELKFINSYVELEKLRYDDNGRIQLRVEEKGEGKFISPLLLIQFVENAFKHGIEEGRSDSFLEVHVAVKDNRLSYRSLNSINRKSINDNGIGLSSVRKRLDMLYPGHRLMIDDANSTYKVELELNLSPNS